MPLKSDNPARAAARARFAHFSDDDGEPSGMIDHDNPPLTDAELARLRPAAEVNPEIVASKRKGCRTTSSTQKAMVSMRLDLDLVEALRSSGEG